MSKKLERAIKKAEETINRLDIKDEELRKVAYAKSIDFFLNKSTKDLALSEKEVLDRKSSKSDSQEGSFWIQLGNAIGYDTDELKDIFSLKAERQVLLILPNLKGKTKVEQRRHLAALILLAYHEGFGEEWVQANLLAEAAKHSHLYSTSKFAKNLRAKDEWFRTKGKGKGLEYKLSGPGIAAAQEYLKELIGHE